MNLNRNLTDYGEYSYTWLPGKQFQGISGTNLATSYKYNENGFRTDKTVNGQKHEYTDLGRTVTREMIRDSCLPLDQPIHYSGEESPVGMSVNGVEDYLLKNGQGDISHIVDADGTEVASSVNREKIRDSQVF